MKSFLEALTSSCNLVVCGSPIILAATACSGPILGDLDFPSVHAMTAEELDSCPREEFKDGFPYGVTQDTKTPAQYRRRRTPPGTNYPVDRLDAVNALAGIMGTIGANNADTPTERLSLRLQVMSAHVAYQVREGVPEDIHPLAFVCHSAYQYVADDNLLTFFGPEFRARLIEHNFLYQASNFLFCNRQYAQWLLHQVSVSADHESLVPASLRIGIL